MTDSQRILVEGLGRLPQFAHATVADGFVFVSGTLGTAESGELVPGGVTAETRQTMRNIATILEAAGATWDSVLKVNVHLADIDEYAQMNAAYEAFFDGTPPARMTSGNVGLAMGARVEIECVAHVDRSRHKRTPAEPARETLSSGE